MIGRLNKLLVTFAAVAALGVGGAAFAAAQHAGTGHQTASRHQVHKHHRTAAASGNAGGGSQEGSQGDENVQEGDQSAPDTGQSGAEQGGSEDNAQSDQEADGPGGHADAEGANVEHQFEGEE